MVNQHPASDDILAILRGLRQDRTFLPDPVPPDHLAAILEVARWTGSAKNTQPWHLVVVEDAAHRRVLAEAGQYAGFLAGAPVVIVIALNGYAERQEAYDGGRLSERIMLAASALGLGSGTGWFGSAESEGAVRETLGIPDEWHVWSAIGIGYADPQAARSTPVGSGRRTLADIVSVGRVGESIRDG